MLKGIRGGSETRSFVGALREQDFWGFLRTGPGVDADGNDIEVPLDPVENGEYTTDGSLALTTDLSIGQGRGSTKVQITASDLREVQGFLKSYDPDAPQGHRSVLDIVKATITKDDEFYRFKVSDAPNSRTVSVPVGAWDGFVEFLGEMTEDIPNKVAEFREIVVEMNKSEREKSRK